MNSKILHQFVGAKFRLVNSVPPVMRSCPRKLANPVIHVYYGDKCACSGAAPRTHSRRAATITSICSRCCSSGSQLPHLDRATQKGLGWFHLRVNDAPCGRISDEPAPVLVPPPVRDSNRLPMRNNQICNCYLSKLHTHTHTCARILSSLLSRDQKV